MKKNPWLEIPLSDYLNHMSSSGVKQYQMINSCFKTALEKYKPRTIFVPGCTTGNGFEYIEWTDIEIVTALDLNNDYLNELEKIHWNRPNLEIVNEDLLEFTCSRKYDLIFAALVFEYVEVESALKKFTGLMKQGSVLYSIIQLPNESLNKISKTKYKSLERLSSIMKLVDMNQFYESLFENGFTLLSDSCITLQSGKSFAIIEAKRNP